MSSVSTCKGSVPTGAVLGYDNERRMTSWQSAPSNPGATAADAYDGEGHRVAQSVTAGGSTTTTYYVAGLEEQANVSGGSSTLTKHYSVPGVISAVNVGGTLSFLASDGLGSVSEALSSTSTAATSQQLYSPYGGLRYATGNMPTAKGYTGQYTDASSSGLDYYNAWYYDPLVGQFASADSQADGLNRYGYVAGNPETLIDPSGHRVCQGANCDGGGGGGSGDGGGGGGSGGGCASENQDCGGGGCHTNCGGGHGGSGHGGGGGSGGKPHGGCHGGCNARTNGAGGCTTQECVRDAYLKSLDSDIQTKNIAAFAIQILALLTAVLTRNKADAILEFVLDAVDLVHGLLYAVGKKIMDDGGSPDTYSTLMRVAGVVDQLGSLAQMALGWWQTAGWVMQAAINGAVFAIKTAAEGVGEVLMDVTWQALGGAMSLVMNGVADNLFAQAAAEQANENDQANMDIGSWCSQYGGGACAGLPPS